MIRMSRIQANKISEISTASQEMIKNERVCFCQKSVVDHDC